MIKKVAILTSGGDAPGMNNAIIAIAKNAKLMGIEPYVVYEGYKGLVENNIKKLDVSKSIKYMSTGGTFIYSARYPEFKKPEVREKAKMNLEKMGIEALIVIGGDGSYQGAQLLHEIGIKTIALPGTIDNDISSTDVTIGYNTALDTIVRMVDRVRDTMQSHGRTAIVEVMGHGCGDLALYSGLATAAEIIVTNDNVMTEDELAAMAAKISNSEKRSIIIIVSEFIYKDLDALAEKVTKASGRVTRALKLAHTQRGGHPVVQERIAATRMGINAIERLAEGKSGIAIGIIRGELVATPILEALDFKRSNNKEKNMKYNKFNQVQ